MIPENIRVLLGKLKDRTNQKKVIWQLSSGTQEFKVRFGSGTITIDDYFDQNGVEYVSYAIFNNDGESIIGGHFREDDDDVFDFNLIKNIHQHAFESFYKYNDTLKGIMKEIESGKEIGNDE